MSSLPDKTYNNLIGTKDALRTVADGLVYRNDTGIGTGVTGRTEDTENLLEEIDKFRSRYDKKLIKSGFCFFVAVVLCVVATSIPNLNNIVLSILWSAAASAVMLGIRLVFSYFENKNSKEYNRVGKVFSSAIDNQSLSTEKSISTSLDIQDDTQKGMKIANRAVVNAKVRSINAISEKEQNEMASETMQSNLSFLNLVKQVDGMNNNVNYDNLNYQIEGLTSLRNALISPRNGVNFGE